MQVPQVTEDIALAVLDMYPTLLSLAREYSLLVSLLLILTIITTFIEASRNKSC